MNADYKALIAEVEREAQWGDKLAERVVKALIADDVAPEQARFVLPQGVIVNWIWTGSLAAYSRFYKQRTDPHAQREVQVIAEMVGAEIEKLFPVSWKALTK